MNKKCNVIKKSISLFLVIVFFLSVSLVSQAAVSFPMNETNVKWDLKPNKTIRVKSIYLGVGMKPVDIRITKFKKKKQGIMMTVSFDILFDSQCYKPSQTEVHKMIRRMNQLGEDFVGGATFCFILDYNNGRNLDWEEHDDWEWDPADDYGYNEAEFNEKVKEARSNPKVTVTRKLKKRYSRKTYRDNHGCYVWLEKELYHITIICPGDYNSLCIGVGGPYYFFDDITDEKWMYGVAPFGLMRDYKKNPKNWHFMRV